WRVRAAVLLGCAREIRPAGDGRAAGPDELAARLDLRREQLVLEVAAIELHALHQLCDAFRLGDVPSERLLACDAAQRTLPCPYGLDDLLDVLDACAVRTAQPDRVDARVGDHLADRAVCACSADLELARERRGCFRILPRRAVDAEYVRITDAGKRADVELRVEAAADEADTETVAHAFSMMS